LTTGGNSYFPGIISCITDDVEEEEEDDDDNSNNNNSINNNMIKLIFCYFVKGIMLLTKYLSTGVCRQVPCKKP